MYVAGNSSYTDILIGSTDFYDMLMKIELVKRVADHDNTMIDGLVELKGEYESQEAELEANKTELETNKATLEEQKAYHTEQKKKLDDLYAKSQAVIDQLEEDKAAYEANKEQINKEQEDFEAQLQKLYKEQEQIKKKEEEERKKKKRKNVREERKKNVDNSSNSRIITAILHLLMQMATPLTAVNLLPITVTTIIPTRASLHGLCRVIIIFPTAWVGAGALITRVSTSGLQE